MKDQVFTGAQPLDAGAQPGQAATSPSQEPATSQVNTEPATPVELAEGNAKPGETTPPAAQSTDELAKYKDPKTGLFFGKYKTAADAFDAHTELRRVMGQQGTLLDTLRNQQQAQQQAQQPQVQPQVQQPQMQGADIQAQLSAMMAQDPAQALMYMAQLTRQQTLRDVAQTVGPVLQSQMLEGQVAKLAQQYPDFADLKDDIQEVLKKDNGATLRSVQQNPALLEDVYWMARGKASERLIRTARENAVAEANKNNAVKPGAGGAPGAARVADGSITEESIVTGIFEKQAATSVFK